jgi:hypothetical protein
MIRYVIASEDHGGSRATDVEHRQWLECQYITGAQESYTLSRGRLVLVSVYQLELSPSECALAGAERTELVPPCNALAPSHRRSVSQRPSVPSISLSDRLELLN